MSKNEKAVPTFMGTVVNNKMKDTVVVLIERQVKHTKYGKFIKRSIKVHAHDQGNKCQEGDIIIVRETRPISKTKRWALVKVIGKAKKV
ncbi:MAG: 30S ribosomal protein S17 [Coxiella endosymbiont of Haemaphysalis qinghaiensis]